MFSPQKVWDYCTGLLIYQSAVITGMLLKIMNQYQPTSFLYRIILDIRDEHFNPFQYYYLDENNKINC